MRISHVSYPFWMIPWAAVILVGCGDRPKKSPVQDHVDLPAQSGGLEQKAVWIATTNYDSGGTLARLDLSSGSFTQRVLDIGPDVLIFQDDADGLFLLSRGREDSITLVRGAEATVAARVALPQGINAQAVARDSLGRVWVTCLDSNDVMLFSSDLSVQVGAVDLSSLREENSADGYAELAQVTALDSDRMVVSAQRLRRGVGNWRPDPMSGLAIINIHSLQVEYLGLVEVSNPMAVLARKEPANLSSSILVVGGGDLVSAQGQRASISRFEVHDRSWATPSIHSYNVLSAFFSSMSEEPSLIAWYRSEHQSCVQVGARKVVCDGSRSNAGYVFNRVIRESNRLFVSYIGTQSPQLWIVPMDGSEPQKVRMRLPIESMSFGP